MVIDELWRMKIEKLDLIREILMKYRQTDPGGHKCSLFFQPRSIPIR